MRALVAFLSVALVAVALSVGGDPWSWWLVRLWDVLSAVAAFLGDLVGDLYECAVTALRWWAQPL